jgi:chromosome segregation ATPase
VVDELERTQTTLAKQEKLYVTCKKALASERSEVETLCLEVDQAENVIATLEDDLNTLQEKNNALKIRNEELEEQFSILWDKTSHPTKTSEISNASTSKGCDRAIMLI